MFLKSLFMGSLVALGLLSECIKLYSLLAVLWILKQQGYCIGTGELYLEKKNMEVAVYLCEPKEGVGG